MLPGMPMITHQGVFHARPARQACAARRRRSALDRVRPARSCPGQGAQGRNLEAHPRHLRLLLREVRSRRLHRRGHSVREPDRRQERGAHLLGAAAGEPVLIVANANNRGMAVMAGVNTDIKTIKDLKGKKVAIWPGSTQEAVILERLRMEGMSIKDIQPIRLQFSDHAAALARGDVDAYVGAEPAAGISLANGTGRLVEYPYSTAIGPLNMILSASEKAVKDNPARIKLVVDMHRQAVDYAMAHPGEIVEMAMQKLGQQKKSVELAVPNVELAWKLDDVFMERANAYTRLMYENKQIRQVPDLNRHITKQFM